MTPLSWCLAGVLNRSWIPTLLVLLVPLLDSYGGGGGSWYRSGGGSFDA